MHLRMIARLYDAITSAFAIRIYSFLNFLRNTLMRYMII